MFRNTSRYPNQTERKAFARAAEWLTFLVAMEEVVPVQQFRRIREAARLPRYPK